MMVLLISLTDDGFVNSGIVNFKLHDSWMGCGAGPLECRGHYFILISILTLTSF